MREIRITLLIAALFTALTACNSGKSHNAGVRPLPTVSPIVQMANDGDVPPPISISSVIRTYSKRTPPPTQYYAFEFELTKRRDGYTWLLIPRDLDQPLPESGEFKNESGLYLGLGADEYAVDSKGGKVVVIHSYGANAFRAIRVSEDGTIKFNPLTLSSRMDMSELVVWEVRAILINGETPLEDWLPFDSSSQAGGKPINTSDDEQSKSLQFETNVHSNMEGRFTPKSKVEFLKAVGIRRWVLPFKVSESKQ